MSSKLRQLHGKKMWRVDLVPHSAEAGTTPPGMSKGLCRDTKGAVGKTHCRKNATAQQITPIPQP